MCELSEGRDRIADSILLRMTRVADGVDMADRLGSRQVNDAHAFGKLIEAEMGERCDSQPAIDHVGCGDERVRLMFELHSNPGLCTGVEEDRSARAITLIVVDPGMILELGRGYLTAHCEFLSLGISSAVRIFQKEAAVDLRRQHRLPGLCYYDLYIGSFFMPLALRQAQLGGGMRVLVLEEEDQRRHPSVPGAAEVADRKAVDSAVLQVCFSAGGSRGISF